MLVVLVTGAVHAAEQESHGHSGAHMVSPGPPSLPRGNDSLPRRRDDLDQHRADSTQELRGKVVLIDFWTYTCINWRRTVPSLRAWVERYGTWACS